VEDSDYYSWSVPSAVWQIKHGEKGSARTESADGWIYGTIAREAQAGHPLIVGTIAVMLMDALTGKG
jgi:hypothetical protein